MSAKLLHFSTGRGLGGGVTACGKSMHGWQGKRTPIATDDPRRVECTRCRKALGLR